jgi:hypothetical protein
VRTPWALLVAALFLPFALPAAGQAPADAPGPVHLLDDHAGDVQVTASGQVAPSGGRFAAADVTGLDVAETQDDLTFTLKAASLQSGGDAPFVETIVYRIGFLHNDRQFRVLMVRSVFQSASYTAQLQAFDGGRGGYFSLTRMGAATADEGAGTISATFAKDLLVDEEGNAPQPQVPFTGWHVLATSLGTAFFAQGNQLCLGPAGCQAPPNLQASDSMPDQGNGTADLALRFGVVQTGHARLSSPTPTRASNGEATTIVYQVTARNLGPASEMFMLGAAGAPGGWDVQLPAEHVTIPGNGTLVFPVLLTMPFTHQHGTYQFFVVTLTSMKDSGSVGRVQLGVRFSQPPQPAGHHNALWLHTADNQNFFDQLPGGEQASDATFGTGASLYMNALDSDPLDSHLAVPGQPCFHNAAPTVPPQASYCWDVPLSPGLEIGLDFDLNKTGTISVPVTTTPPMPGATLRGALDYFPPANATGGRNGLPRPGQNTGGPPQPTELAQVRPKAPVDIQAGSSSAPTILVADLAPTVQDPYVPFVKGASLVLHLEVDFTGMDVVQFPNQESPPFIQPGGTVTELPLFEYHDRVNQLFASSSALMLAADGAQDRMVNPGRQVLFNLTLMNHGSASATVDLQLKGTNAEWAQVLAPAKTQVTLPAGSSLPVAVAVTVPKGAAASDGSGHGDMADLILSATSATDLNQRTLARLHVMVDGSRDWPSDEAAIQAMQGLKSKKGTPGLEMPLLAAALAVALLARRRILAE